MNTQPTASATVIASKKRGYAGFLTRNRRSSLFLFIALCAFPAGGALADDQRQSLDSIRHAVKTFIAEQHVVVGEDTQIQISRLDSRLRLAACESPLNAFAPHANNRPGNMTVGVRCEGERPWTVYVPVRIDSYIEVLTLTTAVTRGTVLKESDLRPIRRNLATLPQGYFTDPVDVIGREARRSLRAGDIISPNAIAEPHLVNRGQEVWLTAEGGGISVSAKAEAMQDGAQGDRIQVRNLSSRRVIEAEVIGPQQVRTAL